MRARLFKKTHHNLTLIRLIKLVLIGLKKYAKIWNFDFSWKHVVSSFIRKSIKKSFYLHHSVAMFNSVFKFCFNYKHFFIFFCSFCMAEGKEPKGFSFDDDDDEWMSSKVTGFKFEDDDETPFQGLNTSFISSLFWPRLLFTIFASKKGKLPNFEMSFWCLQFDQKRICKDFCPRL